MRVKLWSRTSKKPYKKLTKSEAYALYPELREDVEAEIEGFKDNNLVYTKISYEKGLEVFIEGVRKMLEKIALLIFCHIIGDYLFQPRFIANTKGSSWYHMFIHCVLYIVPFWFFFGFSWQLGVVFIIHVIIDAMKARWGLIGYSSDQMAHYGVLLLYIPSLCKKFYGDKISIFDIYDIWVFIGVILAGVMVKVICDIFLSRKDHKLEMEEYYERLGDSPHNWGY